MGIHDLKRAAFGESGQLHRHAVAGGLELRSSGRADEADDRAQVGVLRVIGRDGHVALDQCGRAIRGIGQHQGGGRAGRVDIESAREQRHVARLLQLRHLQQRGLAHGVGENHVVAVEIEPAIFRPFPGQRAEGNLGRAGAGGQFARVIEVVALAPRRAGVGLEKKVRAVRGLRVAAVAAVESHPAPLHPTTRPAARHAHQIGVEKLRRLAARPELYGHAFIRRTARLGAFERALAVGVLVGRREEAAVIHLRPLVGGAGGKRGETEDRGGEERCGSWIHGWDEVLRKQAPARGAGGRM